MIRKLSKKEVFRDFFDLMIEIEAGDHFDASDEAHITWLNRQITRRFGAGAQFFGLYQNDIPVGLAAVVVDDHPEFPGYSELVDLGIYPDYRLQGFGSALIEFAEQLSIKAGVFCMYIATYAGDTDAISFYRKNGYLPVCTLPDVHGPDDRGRLYLEKRFL
ncbi:MAG: GNAT family N-acetyltransferase [FCB group bacterium]|nr:GNAT family N-acetyltransferase [FCB group bacterium]